MPVVNKQWVKLLAVIVLGLSLLMLVDSGFAQRGGGGKGGWGGGGRRGGGGRVRTVQQKPGKPAEVRFLRVCRVLLLEEGQLEDAMKAFDSMTVKKAKKLEEQQLGAISSLAAKQEIKKIGGEFEEKFIALLDEEQRKKLEKLKQDGTLGDRWW